MFWGVKYKLKTDTRNPKTSVKLPSLQLSRWLLVKSMELSIFNSQILINHHGFILPVLNVILAFPLKRGRMSALCRACSHVELIPPGPAAPFQGGPLQPNSPNPSILEGRGEIPTHFIVGPNLLAARAAAQGGIFSSLQPFLGQRWCWRWAEPWGRRAGGAGAQQAQGLMLSVAGDCL